MMVGVDGGHVWPALVDIGFTAKCAVESLDVTVQGSGIPKNLRRRISFQAHDFFNWQALKGAEV